MRFWEERFQKKKNSDDTVKQITMPQFLQKVGKI